MVEEHGGFGGGVKAADQLATASIYFTSNSSPRSIHPVSELKLQVPHSSTLFSTYLCSDFIHFHRLLSPKYQLAHPSRQHAASPNT